MGNRVSFSSQLTNCTNNSTYLIFPFQNLSTGSTNSILLWDFFFLYVLISFVGKLFDTSSFEQIWMIIFELFTFKSTPKIQAYYFHMNKFQIIHVELFTFIAVSTWCTHYPHSLKTIEYFGMTILEYITVSKKCPAHSW